MRLCLTPPFPRIAPIVPVLRPAPFNDPAWLFEPKYDGFRGILYLTRKTCTLYSKRGNPMARFQGLADQLRAELPRREVILDGEVIGSTRTKGSTSWPHARSRRPGLRGVRSPLAQRAESAGGPPLTQRKKRLERLIPAAVGALNRVPCFEEEGRALLAAACSLDLEGDCGEAKARLVQPSDAMVKGQESNLHTG